MKNILRFVFSFALVFGAVVIASFFISPQASSWYGSITKPPFAPPDQLFAPVWILSYVLIALALARVWALKETIAWRMWCFTFGTQLLLSVLWGILFFTLHGVFFASIDAIVLWFAVVVLTADSWDIDRLAFWLLVPYFAWVTFIMILSIGIWWVN